MSLNLEKMQKQLDEALEKETKESILEWLNEQRTRIDQTQQQVSVEPEVIKKTAGKNNYEDMWNEYKTWTENIGEWIHKENFIKAMNRARKDGMKFLAKHKVLFNPGILSQEFAHVALGRKKYWIKYIFNKKFRLSEQRKRKALDDWSDEMDRFIFLD